MKRSRTKTQSGAVQLPPDATRERPCLGRQVAADRMAAALHALIGHVDFTQHCCSPFAMVAAALPEETLAEARAAYLAYKEISP